MKTVGKAGRERKGRTMIEIRGASSLEKGLLGREPEGTEPLTEGFENEVISWQLAFRNREGKRASIVEAEVISPLQDRISVLRVNRVPVGLAVYGDVEDDNYLSREPGLYPDLLTQNREHSLRMWPDQWEWLWITCDPAGETAPGRYPVTIRFRGEDGGILGEDTREVTILPGSLPKQQLIQTRWFHADCLADSYHVAPFSEEHWRILENFVGCAVKAGINMLLTPIHTPPLDTRPGGERTTVQLVGIRIEDGRYHFDLSRLRRWIAMGRRCGVEYFEMAHLFTQWGAKHAPKIVATVDGREQRIFGWETDAAGAAYGDFLREYIPAVRGVFREEGMEDRVWWHLSDEPSGADLPAYLAARSQVEEALRGAKIMDALSDYDFYQQGIVTHPVVASNHMEPFLEHGVQELWMYYCCAQNREVSNLFIAMPSARNRILGAQLYRYRIQGFLQWGYNFYNSMLSDRRIDPYACTDADGAFPAGDPFLVYPGADGEPELSIRYMVAREAVQDLRALEWLETLQGREAAMKWVEHITLTKYPRDAETLLNWRRGINREILQNA